VSVKVKIDWRGDQVKAKVRQAVVEALRDATEHVLEEANRTIPLEEGTMQRSGLATVNEGKLVGTVSYDTTYAIKQHEDLTLRHDPGRRAKWLELTLDERADAVRKHFAKKIEDALR
jgi:hypothetical protein